MNRQKYHPNLLINEKSPYIVAPYTRDYPIPADGVRFYLCSGSKCMPPVSEFSQLLQILDKKKISF